MADLRPVPPETGRVAPRAERPRRRAFSAEYKLAILAEYDALTEPGAKGALLAVAAAPSRLRADRPHFAPSHRDQPKSACQIRAAILKSASDPGGRDCVVGEPI